MQRIKCINVQIKKLQFQKFHNELTSIQTKNYYWLKVTNDLKIKQKINSQIKNKNWNWKKSNWEENNSFSKTS